MTDPMPGGPADEPRLPAEEEPKTTGTMVILMLFMMALIALWTLMYRLMLER
ncbi:MAG: hypothetical protein R3195_14220 [Gemmatimonadota bacterium]|nr:hypothetical protein [Gemmatimonadota bacterium]